MLTALRALFTKPTIETHLRSELLHAMERHRRAETSREENDALLGVIVSAVRLANHLESMDLSTSDVACKCSAEEGTASP